MDGGVLLVVGFSILAVGVLAYIFVDQRRNTPTPNPSQREGSGALSPSRREGSIATSPSEREIGNARSNPQSKIQNLKSPTGGIGGRQATNPDIAPPIASMLPTTQPPIQPVMPARRPRPAPPVTLPVPPLVDEPTDTAPHQSQSASYSLAATNTGRLRSAAIPTDSGRLRSAAIVRVERPTLPTTEQGRVFRHVSLDPEAEAAYDNYLPNSRLSRSATTALPTIEQPRDRSSLFGILLALVVIAVLVVGVWFGLNLLAGKRGDVSTNQLALVITSFGANDGGAAQEFSTQVAAALQSSSLSLNPTLTAVRCCLSSLAADTQAATQAAKSNADILLWGDTANSGATALRLSYYLKPNGPFNSVQRQSLFGQLLDPISFTLPIQSRASMQDKLVGFSAGLILYYGDKVTEADEKFKAALAGGLDLPTVHFYHANCLLLLGDMAGAVSEYGKAGGVDDMAMQNNRGLAEAGRADYPAAQADYDAAIAQQGGQARSAYSYRNRGLAHLAQRQFDAATADLQQATQLDPNSAPIWYDLATALFDVNADPPSSSLDAAQNALNAYNNALTLDNVYPMADIQRAALRLSAGGAINLGAAQADLTTGYNLLTQRDGALRAEETAMRDQHNTEFVTNRLVANGRRLGLAHYWLGRSYIVQGQQEVGKSKGWFDFLSSKPNRYQQAIDEFNQALLTAQDDAYSKDYGLTAADTYTTHYWMAEALAANGDLNGAAWEWGKAKQIDPHQPRAYLRTAALYDGAGQHDLAASEYEALVKANPGYIHGYLLAADEYAALKQPEQQADAWRRATQQPPVTATDWHDRGTALDGLQDYVNAAASYAEAVKRNDKDGSAWYKLAEDSQRIGQPDAAIDAYQHAATLKFAADRANYRIGQIYAAQGNLAEAGKWWTLAIQANDHFLLAHYMLAKTAWNNGNSDEALKQYRFTEQSDPATAAGETPNLNDAMYDTHLQLGNLYRDRADYANAEAEYRTAIDNFEQDDLTPSVALCSLYVQTKNTSMAVTLANAILSQFPDNTAAYSCRGRAYFYSDDLSKLGNAEKDLQQALTLKPDDTDAQVTLGYVFITEGRDDLAEAQFTTAAGRASNLAAPHIGLGEIRLHQSRWAEAQTEFNTAINLDGNSATAYTGLGRTFAQQGNLSDAEQNYRTAIKRDPNLADPHFWLAQLLDSQNQSDAAIGEYETAIKLRPRWVTALVVLGHAYLKKNIPDKAIIVLTSATKYQPDDAEAFYELGNAYRATNQRDNAVTAYQAATKLNPSYAAAWYWLGRTDEDSGNRPAAADAYIHARDTATDPDLKRQAGEGLARVQ